MCKSCKPKPIIIILTSLSLLADTLRFFFARTLFQVFLLFIIMAPNIIILSVVSCRSKDSKAWNRARKCEIFLIVIEIFMIIRDFIIFIILKFQDKQPKDHSIFDEIFTYSAQLLWEYFKYYFIRKCWKKVARLERPVVLPTVIPQEVQPPQELTVSTGMNNSDNYNNIDNDNPNPNPNPETPISSQVIIHVQPAPESSSNSDTRSVSDS